MKKYRLLNLLITALLFSCSCGIKITPSAHPANDPGVVKDIRVLSDRWICVVLDPTAKVINLRDAKYGPQLKQEWAYKQENPQDWKYDLSIKYHTVAAIQEFRPHWIKEIDSSSNWTINGKHPEKATFWPQSVDGFPAWSPNFSSDPEYLDLPRLVDFVYLELPDTLNTSNSIIITGPAGIKATLNFNDRENLCWAIKINQLGYVPDAPKKYAYLGAWLGAAGPASFSAFQNQPFYIYDYSPKGVLADKPAFTGHIQLRVEDKQLRYGKEPISGEDVYELDFSPFNQTGTYCIVIPGLGRSLPFNISPAVYGEAFYTAMRGLFHQRCGIALKEPYTSWTRPACHTLTYKGGFPSEADSWYENPNYDEPQKDGTVSYGFKDNTGHPVSIKDFTVINATTTAQIIPGLKGGWHDAADFDRRIHHYKIVWNLCGVYEMFPHKFKDGQLNIPESGNGIPDILDEAAVQIDLFKKTQQANGGVSGWIEQTGHPDHSYSPDNDTNPCYLALPDRLSSFAYAGAAAYLGRMMLPFAPKRSEEYIASARRAYEFGMSSKNRIHHLVISIPGEPLNKKIYFDERPELPGYFDERGINPEQVLAAMQLYAATKDHFYLAEWQKFKGIETLLHGLPDGIQPFAFVTPALHPELFGNDALQKIKEAAINESRTLMDGQAVLAYRNLWRTPEHPYFTLMAWGSVHSANRARMPLLAWRLTGNQEYRKAMLLGTDWELGCNEMGRSFVSGLGVNYQAVFQHIQSQKDHIPEPVPGISPFTLTYGLARSAIRTQFALIQDAKPDTESYFKGSKLCLLPSLMNRSSLQEQINNTNDFELQAKILQESIGRVYPIMRRQFIHPFMEPGQNEFTVYESIAPQAAVYGALLPDGWDPPDSLRKRKPITDFKKLPMYPQP